MSDAELATLLRELVSSDEYIRKKLEALQARRPQTPLPPSTPESPESPPQPARYIGSPRPSPPSPVPSDRMDYASDSSRELQFSATDESSDEFTLVEGKRKKRRAKASSQAAKAPKTVGSATPPTPVPTSEPKRSEAATLPKGKTPPPIYLQDKGKWIHVATWCSDRKINYTSAKSTAQGIRVSVPNVTDYRELVALLRGKGVSFHTYALQEEKQVRVVIRGVPREIDSPAILSDLKSQNIPAVEVHRMHRRGGETYNMVLVVLDPVEGYKAIFNITKICHLSGISVERPHKGGPIGQCHNCQLYGHSRRNCFARPRCVKCLDDHATADCTRPKDRALCTEPPSCVNCGASGHPANYRGCPKAPKNPSPKQAARNNARASRECPTLNTKTPERLSPQRPTAWNLQAEAQFPALPGQTTQSPPTNPKAAPKAATPKTTHAQTHAKTPTKAGHGTKAASAAAPAPAQTATANPSQFVPQLSSSHVSAIIMVSDILESERAIQMASELKRYEGNPRGILITYMAYPDVLEALASLKFNP